MRPDYLRRTQGRVVQVHQSLAAASADVAPAELSNARIVLHDIAGTAPVMGLPELGAMARSAEHRVAPLTQSTEPPSEASLHTLRQDVAALLEALATELGEP